MSHTTERARRQGAALLIAIVISAIVGITTLTLWHSVASANRSRVLETAIDRADALADSATMRAIAFADGGGWTALRDPGTQVRISSVTARGYVWSAELGRIGWNTLVARGRSDIRSGAPDVPARAERRTIIPLNTPLPMPDAAVTGATAWRVDAGATIDVPTPAGRESTCRPPGLIAATREATLRTSLGATRLPRIDPDTLRDSLVGAFQLAGARLRTPLIIHGLLLVDSDFAAEADLRLEGVFVVRGSVHPAGGRLDVRGAVVSGDSLGGHSELGAGDRVRYDACAIRSAVERVTRPAPAAIWTTLTVF
jgi:hypothetical protein